MRRYEFVLAERLSMTRAELGERMTVLELIEWQAHDQLTQAELDFERQQRGG